MWYTGSTHTYIDFGGLRSRQGEAAAGVQFAMADANPNKSTSCERVFDTDDSACSANNEKLPWHLRHARLPQFQGAVVNL